MSFSTASSSDTRAVNLVGNTYIHVVLCTLHVGKENHGFENLDFGKKKIPAETAPQEEQVEHIISASNHLTIWSTG